MATRSVAPSTGNNNGYCQDNELSWMDWEAVDEDMLAFTRLVIALRMRHPIFRRRRFFEGRRIAEWDKVPDISWLQPDAEPMTTRDWQVGYARDPDRRPQRVGPQREGPVRTTPGGPVVRAVLQRRRPADPLPDPRPGSGHRVVRGPGHGELAATRIRGSRDLQRRGAPRRCSRGRSSCSRRRGRPGPSRCTRWPGPGTGWCRTPGWPSQSSGQSPTRTGLPSP